MVDFVAHFTIHAIIDNGFQKYYVLPGQCACESDRRPHYFHPYR